MGSRQRPVESLRFFVAAATSLSVCLPAGGKHGCSRTEKAAGTTSGKRELFSAIRPAPWGQETAHLVQTGCTLKFTRNHVGTNETVTIILQSLKSGAGLERKHTPAPTPRPRSARTTLYANEIMRPPPGVFTTQKGKTNQSCEERDTRRK